VYEARRRYLFSRPRLFRHRYGCSAQKQQHFIRLVGTICNRLLKSSMTFTEVRVMATMPVGMSQFGTEQTAKRSRKGRKRAAAKLSRLHRPEGMSLEDWQTALRRQFGREQKFQLKNVGSEPFFSEFQVTNPESQNTYRVAIRGTEAGDNFCSCPDFATNTLG